jgi:hypothetical protein
VDAATRLGTLVPAPRVAHGRALFAGLDASAWTPAQEGPGAGRGSGLLWGLPDDASLAALLATLADGATVACVIPIERGGARGMLDRVLRVGSPHTPAALEDVCTRLFVSGVGQLRVYELDPRRNVVAVVGCRVGRAPST